MKGQKACYVELARAQEEKHRKLAVQLEEFAVEQKQQFRDLVERHH